MGRFLNWLVFELMGFELVGYVVNGRVWARDSRLRVSGVGFRGWDSPASVRLWDVPYS